MKTIFVHIPKTGGRSVREDCINGEEYDAQWDDLCTVMSWLEEDLEEFDSIDAMIDYKERHGL